MKTSEQIDKLAPAMVAAQMLIKHAVKDSVNPHFKSKYADLGAVWDAVRGAARDTELVVVQTPEHSEDGRVHLTTRVMHTSGQWIEATASIPVAKQDAHGYGSGLTYLRRYSLASMLGVVSDDDDGNAAVEKPKEKPATGFEESSKGVSKIELDGLSPAEQEIMRVHADTIIDLHNAGLHADAAEYCVKRLDNHEKQLAVWALLPSNVRSAIKKNMPARKADLATQP